jgi:hypothetical protein
VVSSIKTNAAHDPACNCWQCDPEAPLGRARLTWQCDNCGSEFDEFTYGGPCVNIPCPGELRHKKPAAGAFYV